MLVAGGYGGTSDLASAELYDLVSGTWEFTGSLAEGRSGHTATLLADGKVLVAGGTGGSGELATAELYDPASGTWTLTGSLADERTIHTATLLPNGKVLVAGGGIDSGLGFIPIGSAELYDPASGTWSATDSLNQPRWAHGDAATQWEGARRKRDFPSRFCERGTLRSGHWDLDSRPGPPYRTRNHTATLLPTGRVLVAGGSGVARAELYDPASGTWKGTGRLGTARSIHTATLLPNGKVLVAGGISGNGKRSLASAELYDSRPRIQQALWK